MAQIVGLTRQIGSPWLTKLSKVTRMEFSNKSSVIAMSANGIKTLEFYHSLKNLGFGDRAGRFVDELRDFVRSVHDSVELWDENTQYS